MGSNVAPLVLPFQHKTTLPKGEVVAVDGHNAVLQAMSKTLGGQAMGAWRGRDGLPVAHLYGILFRATGILRAGAKPWFVFDGKPAEAKGRKDYDRIQAYNSYLAKAAKAKQERDEDYLYWLLERPAFFWPRVFADVKRLLSYLGCPYMLAAGEGEAQAAFLNMAGFASAVISQDYDALLFGAPRLLRRLPGPKSNYAEILLADVLKGLGATREQLVDAAILAGTDFHPGVPGVGPKKALQLAKAPGGIDRAPSVLRVIPAWKIEELRGLFLAPDVNADVPTPLWRAPSRESLVQSCCREHHCDALKVANAADRWAKALFRKPRRVRAKLH